MMKATLTAALIALATPALAENPDLACLQSKVTVSNPHMAQNSFKYELCYEATNNLDWAIGVIWFAYEVKTDGWTVPWSRDRAGMAIAGGIEPGETRTVRLNTAFNIPSDPLGDLVAVVEVQNVGDHLERPLLEEPGREQTDLTCEPNCRP